MKAIIGLAAVLPLMACATITRGSNTAFVVETEPSGAHVSLSTGQTCDATPCTFARIPRDSEFSVTITRPGYQTTTHAVTHRTAGGGGAAMAGNVLVGGLIGGVIDANSGATQDLVPNPLRVTLNSEMASTAAPAPAVAAATTEAAPPTTLTSAPSDTTASPAATATSSSATQ